MFEFNVDNCVYISLLLINITLQGVLPVEYLSGSDFVKAEGLFANAQQMLSQYEVKVVMYQVNYMPSDAMYQMIRLKVTCNKC